MAGLALWPVAAWWLARDQAGWVVMIAVAFAEFFALKLLTLTAVAGQGTSPLKRIAYLFLWPGMDARSFLLRPRDRNGRTPGAKELLFAVAKLACGLAACVAAVVLAGKLDPLAVAWVGMLGIVFALHFGALHLASWAWRRAGVAAPPIMRAPIASESLAEFWGGRWNAAFADAARRFLFMPAARRVGAKVAGALVFLASGLIHESVISLPAKGGWGGPTLYFAVQGAGLMVEKSRWGTRMGLGVGARGWLWTFLVTVLPLPLLFHRPFATRVIFPIFETLNRHLS